MNLQTSYNVDGISITTKLDNNTTIIASKVKITNKVRQSANNAKEKLENTYNSNIDKGIKKQSFYNKHKNK